MTDDPAPATSTPTSTSKPAPGAPPGTSADGGIPANRRDTLARTREQPPEAPGPARARPGTTRRQLGTYGEELAARWYRRRGYRVVARNWRCRNGELDLVLRRGNTLVFCEVKTRRSRRFGSPAAAVTPAKQRRIRRLATSWLAATGNRAPVLRFDVAAVEHGRVQVITAAF